MILDAFTFGSAIEIRSGDTQPPYGPVLFDVSNNRITVDGFGAGGPRFVGPDDFHLLPDSAAVDAGENARVLADITADLEGAPRIQQTRVDMGAYESPSLSPAEVPALGPFGLLALAAGLGAAGAVPARRRR